MISSLRRGAAQLFMHANAYMYVDILCLWLSCACVSVTCPKLNSSQGSLAYYIIRLFNLKSLLADCWLFGIVFQQIIPVSNKYSIETCFVFWKLTSWHYEWLWIWLCYEWLRLAVAKLRLSLSESESESENQDSRELKIKIKLILGSWAVFEHPCTRLHDLRLS